MKKILLFLLLLFFNSIYAYECSRNCLPCFHSPIGLHDVSYNHFYLNISGLFFQPSSVNNDINIIGVQHINNDNFKSKVTSFDHNYQWGSEISVGTDLRRGLDINLFYSEWKGRDDFEFNHATEGAFSTTNSFITNILDINGNTQDVIANPISRFLFKQVDLTLGRRYEDCCARLTIHPSLGLRFTDLKHIISIEASGHLTTPPLFMDIDISQILKSKFNGFGPVGGLDMFYFLPNNFLLVGRFNTSVLTGSISSYHQFIVTTGSPQAARFNNEFEKPKNRRVVVSLGGKLGIGYAHCIKKSKLQLELGYSQNKYFNSIDLIRGDVAIDIAGLSSGNQKITSIETEDFALNGPYASLTISF